MLQIVISKMFFANFVTKSFLQSDWYTRPVTNYTLFYQISIVIIICRSCPFKFFYGITFLHITVLDHEENRSAFKELLSLIVQESPSPSLPTKQRCSQGMERAITRHLHHHHLYHHHLQGSQQNRVVVKEWTEQSLRDRQDQQQSRITQQDQPRGQQLSLSRVTRGLFPNSSSLWINLHHKQ